MSKSIRVRTTPGNGDKFIKFNIDQDFDFIEILSLKISQEEVYSQFSADYGVLVGRVTTNHGGLGIPNAKVSIFIPISEEDKDNPHIFGLYPFDSVNDKDSNGVRYNLLRDEQSIFNDCHQIVGTMSDKREVLDNDIQLEIYEKYYKFTTSTNASGDYMIFGIPVGTHVAHMDVDLSDIGEYSQKPYDFINQGYSLKQFESYTKFRVDEDLDLLPQIKSGNVGVNIIPFWTGVEGEEAGITRADFDIPYRIQPSALFIGSLFGDNEKNSLSKNCRPRKNLGKLCETVTGPGSIEMIRKTYDGRIERFDVDGGRVIDENGTWNYFIPMNKDYMVTDEFGNLVPTEDISKGIPTTSDVRFRIGMDVSGGEGRLRTRAKHLVPNNPYNGDVDYIFDETTPDTQFTSLRMGGIYTVRNFIQRFQRSCGPNCVDNRNFIGIKDVDNCPGDKNPFPYNRVDTDLNPLYRFLCLLLKVIVNLLVLINSIILTVVNLIIFIVNLIIQVINIIVSVLNSVIQVVNGIIQIIGNIVCLWGVLCSPPGEETIPSIPSIPPIDYIRCITIECDNQVYAPGCFDNLTWQYDATVAYWGNGGFHYPGDGHVGHGVADELPLGSAGLVNCLSASLAEELNVYEFDFYNDWVNGTLYQFLVKYKTKKNKKTKFCAYDCADFTPFVDGDEDGNPDVDCDNHYLIDSCVASESAIIESHYQTSGGTTTGTVVVSPNSFPLSIDAKTKNSKQIRDGLIKEVDDVLYYVAETHTTGNILYATDITYLGQINQCNLYNDLVIHDSLIPTTYLRPPLTAVYNSDGTIDETGLDPLLMSINCLGIWTEEATLANCSNIKMICEIGRDLPNTQYVNIDTIESGVGEFTRQALQLLNINALNHDLYRGFQFHGIGGDDPQGVGVGLPHNNSYFFYFGTEPGKTAIDRANTTFLATCDRIIESEFQISANINNVSTFGGNDGSIDLTVEGGQLPLTFNWSGPNGFNATTEDISGLVAGTYTVVITDDVGLTETKSFIVTGPAALSFTHSHVNVTINGGSDGAIDITNTQNGVPPYQTRISGSTVNGYSTPWVTYTTQAYQYPNLPADIYHVQVKDASGTIINFTEEITEPNAFSITMISNSPNCAGGTGSVTITTNGGIPPFTPEIVGPGGPYYVFFKSNLGAGTYNGQVTDSAGQIATASATVTIPTPLIPGGVVTNVSCNGGNDGGVTLNTNMGGTPPYTASWSDGGTGLNRTNLQAGNITATVTDANGCVDTKSFFVGQPQPLQIIQAIITDVSCNGGNDGTIAITPDGGTPPYTISNTNNLSAGQIQVTVTDANNCTRTQTYTINEPQQLSLTTSVTDTSVFLDQNGAIQHYQDGMIACTATGGVLTSNRQYDLYKFDGVSYVLFITESNVSSKTFTGLEMGTYQVIVTDNNGCTDINTGIIVG